ncbi:MAG: hypothetical protein M3Z16_09755, partial [Pseudomonadota bacterium]|nr:hypothetical protein [Pseudomonadota bacterium]
MLSRLSLVIAAIFGSTAAHAVPDGAAHAAPCVAALKAREPVLAASLRAGAAVEPELLGVVRSGVAIVGRQYLAGV